jgi:hypothetical protein
MHSNAKGPVRATIQPLFLGIYTGQYHSSSLHLINWRCNRKGGRRRTSQVEGAACGATMRASETRVLITGWLLRTTPIKRG